MRLQAKFLWDINTKISASLDLIWRQLFTKYGGPTCTHFEFPAKTVKKFSRAWQAYFLSYNLKIWWEDISFKDIQMVFNHDFDKSSGFQFQFRKIQCECSVHILRSPWPSWEQLTKTEGGCGSYVNDIIGPDLSQSLSQKLPKIISFYRSRENFKFMNYSSKLYYVKLWYSWAS